MFLAGIFFNSLVLSLMANRYHSVLVANTELASVT